LDSSFSDSLFVSNSKEILSSFFIDLAFSQFTSIENGSILMISARSSSLSSISSTYLILK
ncbi:11949_t:CDS:1, partial [Diversispora eburnea]